VLVYERLLGGLRAYTVARILTQAISWSGTVFVVRKLDSHAFGLFGMALVAYNFLALIYDGTLTETLVQHELAERQERRAAFTLLMSLGLLTTATMVVLAVAVSRLVQEPAVAPLAMALSVALMANALAVLPHARLLRTMQFERLAVIASIQAVLTTATTVGLAAAGAGVWALVLGMVAGLIVRTIGLNVVMPSLLRPTRDLRGISSFLRFGGVLFADNLLWRWYISLDTFLLGRWTGATSLGFYSLAQQLADLPLEKITTIVNDVSLPAYAELRGDRPRAAALMLETLRTHATIGFPLFWGLSAVAPLVVPVLFGPKWDDAVLPLMALSAVAPLRLIGSIETPAMTGIGSPVALLRSKSVLVPGMTIALAVGAWVYGIRGAALAWLLAFPILYGCAFRPVLRAIGLSYGQVFAVVRGPATAAALMFGIVYITDKLMRLSAATAVLALLLEVVLGAATYFVSLAMLDRNAFMLARDRAGRLVGMPASK
jgi:teichuronic acid exporter